MCVAEFIYAGSPNPFPFVKHVDHGHCCTGHGINWWNMEAAGSDVSGQAAMCAQPPWEHKGSISWPMWCSFGTVIGCPNCKI